MEAKDDRTLEKACDAFKNFDTGKGLILQRLFKSPQTRPEHVWRQRLLHWVRLVLVLQIVPLAVGYLTLESIFRATGEVKLAFFWDLNLHAMMMLTVPWITILLLEEKWFIPDTICQVVNKGVVVPDIGKYQKFITVWQKRYYHFNVMAQLVAVGVAIYFAYMNFDVFRGGDVGGWQTTNKMFNPVGWIYILWQIPIISWVAAIYVVRTTVTIFMLQNLAAISKIFLDPFHHDRSAGLKTIGRVGLRNQYLLVVVFLNLTAMIPVLRAYGDGDIFADATSFLRNIVYICCGIYLVCGPLVFMGPLVPFRKFMVEERRTQMDKVAVALSEAFRVIMGGLKPGKTFDVKEWRRIERLNELSNMVKRIPVWPFDTRTLQKFGSAYLGPVIVGVAGVVLKEFFKTAAGWLGWA